MKQEDIIRMAREAEIGDSHGYIIANELAHLERFANLVAAAEREATAKFFDGKVGQADLRDIAAAIRARGNTCQE
jgi:hypothetical protein